MKTYLVMVGRTNNTWIDTGIRDYFQRISHYIPFRDIVIHEIKKSKNLPEKEIKNKEGELILKTVSSGDILVLLDENGQHYNSRGFSGFLEQQMIKGVRNLFFVIGGAYGFSELVYERANYKISLSKMTFSHQIVRLIFAEQLYRALSILNNDPYHHD